MNKTLKDYKNKNYSIISYEYLQLRSLNKQEVFDLYNRLKDIYNNMLNNIILIDQDEFYMLNKNKVKQIAKLVKFTYQYCH